VEGSFDRKSKTIWTITPNFEEFSSQNEVLTLCPLNIEIMVSLDKNTWIKSNFSFLIYESNIRIKNITPKCGSLSGNCKCELTLNIDMKNK